MKKTLLIIGVVTILVVVIFFVKIPFLQGFSGPTTIFEYIGYLTYTPCPSC